MKFDENFFEQTYKNEDKPSNKMFISYNNNPLFDNNFNEFITSLNDENFPSCNQELNSYYKCKTRIGSNIMNSFLDNSLKENCFFEDLKKNCPNEIINVYNCLKRYGRYM